MPLDTRDKRSSAIHTSLPWRGMLPVPDGSLNQADRQHVALVYRGILSSGAPVVDDPSDVAGLNFWVRGTQAVYTDEAGTIAAVDGDRITRWNSSVGGNYLFNIGADDNKPIYNTTSYAGSVHDYWRATSGGDTRLLNFNSSYPTNRQAFSGLIIIEPNSTDQRCNLLSFGGFLAANFSIFVQHGTLRVYDGTSTLDSGLRVPSRRCAIVFRASASGVTLYVDTTSTTATVAAAPAGAFTGGAVGEGFGLIQGGWFQLHELALWPSDIGATAAGDMLAYARGAYLISTSYSRRFMFDGDSWTLGYGAARNKTYWRVAGLPVTDDIYSHGLPAQTVPLISADMATEVYPILQGHATPWLVLTIGINDLNGGSNNTAAELDANLQALCNAAKAAVSNLKIVITTVPINPNGSNASVMAQQATYNGWLRERFTLPTQSYWGYRAGPGVTYADRMMDFAAHPQIGISTNPDPVYRLAADNVHLTTAGQAIQGEILYGTLLDREAAEVVRRVSIYGNDGRSVELVGNDGRRVSLFGNDGRRVTIFGN